MVPVTRRVFLAGLLPLLVGVLPGCQSQKTENSGKPVVYTSFYVMTDFAKKIAGDHIDVRCIMPEGGEVHHWEPAPRDMVHLQEADGFIYNGAGMEIWVDKVLDSLHSKTLKVLEASKGLPLTGEHLCSHDHEEGEHEAEHHHDAEADHHDAEAAEHEHEGDADHHDADHHDSEHEHDADHDHEEHAHHHHEPDPHVWLAPMLAKQEMEHICQFFCELDPAHEADYRANYAKYAAECDALDQEFRAAAEGMPCKSLIVTHAAFGYLCRAYGLEQIPLEGLQDNSEPDVATMVKLIQLAKDRNIHVVYCDKAQSHKTAEMLAKEIGGTIRELNPLGQLPQEQIDAGEDYFSVMRQNLKVLAE